MPKRRFLDEILDKHKGETRCPDEFISFMGIRDKSPQYIEASWQLAVSFKSLPSDKQVLDYMRGQADARKALGVAQGASPSLSASLWVKLTFEAMHKHPVHPLGLFSWLQGFHRHIFHVEVGIPYTPHVEGHELKDELEKFILTKWHKKSVEEMRCYEIAETLFTEFKAAYVIVSEEGECGVTLIDSEGA